MWRETIPKLFSFAVAGGFFCGWVYDLLGIFKIVFPMPKGKAKRARYKAAEIFTDLLFCVIFGCIASLVVYYGNEGRFRFAAVVGMTAGWFAYVFTLGKLFKLVLSFVFSLVSKIIKIIFKILAPFAKKIKVVCKNKEAFKFGKLKNSKIVGNKGRGERPFHKSKPLVAAKRKKST